MTQAQVRAAFDAAEEVTAEPPRPLMRELPDADAFPVDALGSMLGAAARAIHDRTQAPLAICGQSVLGAATLAVQGHADVELPTGQTRPVSNFFLSIAETGERKSAADHDALWPIRKREKALRERYEDDYNAWRNDDEAWQAQRRQILGDRKLHGDRAAKKEALDRLGAAPAEPLTPMLTSSEPTLEGLLKLYVTGHPSLGVFSAESGQFIGGHGMSVESKLRTAAGLSILWDGEVIKRVRAGDGATTLPGRRLCLHLMAQPDVATEMLADHLLADQGLLSRVLVTAPAPASGTRFWHEPRPDSLDALRRYSGRLLAILEGRAPMVEGKVNLLAPRPLRLSHEARQGWVKFADHVEGQISLGGDMEPIRGLANKLPEHATRLAAVIALVDDIEAPEISGAHLKAGILLAEHYAAEALRLFAAGRIDPDLLLAQRTLQWLHNTEKWSDPYIGLSDLYRLGPNPIRDSRTARKIVGILEEHGWLQCAEGGAIIKGERRREAWLIRRG